MNLEGNYIGPLMYINGKGNSIINLSGTSLLLKWQKKYYNLCKCVQSLLYRMLKAFN
jgi:hypothetical protein